MKTFKTQKELFTYVLDNGLEIYWKDWDRRYIRNTKTKADKEVYILQEV